MIKEINFTDVILPILAILLVVNSLLNKSEGFTRKDIGEFAIGILIMGFSIWSGISNSVDRSEAKENNKSLNSNLSKLIKNREIDSINSTSFQNALKDSFKIVRNVVTNKPERYNPQADKNNSTKEIDPVLDIPPDKNPVLKPLWHGYKDVLVFVIDEVQEGTIATNISSVMVLVSMNDSGISYHKEDILNANEKSNFIYPSKSIALGYELDRNSFLLLSNSYACLKINFTNKGGVSQKSLIKIFAITDEYDSRFSPIYDEKYDKIVKFLRLKKIF